MKSKLMVAAVGAASVMFSASACESEPIESVPTVVVDEWALVADHGSIGEVAAMDVSEDGTIYIVDRLKAEIIRMSPSGEVIDIFGGRGQGPGEFDRPAAINVGSILRIADDGSGAIHEMDLDGNFVATNYIPEILGQRVAINERGSVAYCTWGLGTTDFARVVNSDGEPIVSIKGLEVPATLFGANFAEINDSLKKGVVPEAFFNSCFPTFGREGSVWLLLDAAGKVRKYGAQGILEWDISYRHLADFDQIRTEYLRRQAADDGASPGFSLLSYFASATVVGDDLVALLNVPDELPSVLLRIAADGNLNARYVLRGLNGLGVGKIAAYQRTLYLMSYETGELYSFSIPSELPAES